KPMNQGRRKRKPGAWLCHARDQIDVSTAVREIDGVSAVPAVMTSVGAFEQRCGALHEFRTSILGALGTEADFLADGAEQRDVDLAGGCRRRRRQRPEQVAEVRHEVESDLVLLVERRCDRLAD